MTRADSFVVGVEQVTERRIEGLIVGQVLAEQEGFEKPGRVRHVPLGGAGIGHRLNDHVLGAEGRNQALGSVSDCLVTLEQLMTGGVVAKLKGMTDHRWGSPAFISLWQRWFRMSPGCCRKRHVL